jgi:hypothetical protein
MQLCGEGHFKLVVEREAFIELKIVKEIKNA